MASVKIPEQKIILCGEYGVGKSSLFRRYATNTFVTATDRKSTLGLDHYEKVYRTGDKEVKVCVSLSSHGGTAISCTEVSYIYIYWWVRITRLIDEFDE